MELKEIDLSKGNGHKHPDIRCDDTQYLAKIGEHFYTGYFSGQWYGLNFEGGPWGAGLQYDSPGTNLSDWKRVWEIIETEEEKAQKSIREIKQQQRQEQYDSLSDHEKELIEYGDYTLDQMLKFKKKRKQVKE